MTESLKQIVNRENLIQDKNKFINSISQLCTQAVNRSIQYGSDNDSSLDNQQVLRMEIKQLKRQNTFLKSKIEQLKKGKNTKHQLNKKKSLNCLSVLKKREQQKKENHLSIDYLMDEILNLLKSVSILFKVQLSEKQWFKFTEDCSLKTNKSQQYQLFEKQKQFSVKLNKKLELLSLQKENHRYQHLLQIFSQFYRNKKETQKIVKNKLQNFIQNAIDMSKNIINKVHSKSLKSSCIYTIKNYEIQNGQSQFDKDDSINWIGQNNIFPFQKMRKDTQNMLSNQRKSQLTYSVIVQPQEHNSFA